MSLSAHSLLPEGKGSIYTLKDPLVLDSGEALSGVEVAYETYGALNAEKSNAILICHALTMDQFAASAHPITGKPGWWDYLIGPGQLFDTNKYFIICPNILGGCMGSTGPSSINPKTGTVYGLSFPVITISDMVRAQAALIDHLGIETLMAVIGGSMGGMQVLQWAIDFPERVFAAAPIATAAKHSAQNIAFHEVGRQAIMADPSWAGGNYYEADAKPVNGLSVARMAAHITYMSEYSLDKKFGRNLQDRDAVGFGFDADFQIESYLRHQGVSFIDRFDANSYLYITRAMDYFDLARGKPLTHVFDGTRIKFLLTSFSTDWLYPTEESKQIVRALHASGADVSFVELESDKGHDAFLLHEPEFFDVLGGFITATATARGI